MPRNAPLPTLPTRTTIAAFVCAAVVLAAAAGYATAPRAPRGTSPLDVSALGKRVLVIAPHPDDETLSTGGTIHRLVASGATVRLVVVSAGDGYNAAAQRLVTGPVDAAAYHLLGDTRHAEGTRAVAELGLAPSAVTFLGYPDKGIHSMWDGSWDASAAVVGSPGSRVVPYDWARRPGVPNCGSELASDLAGILRDFRPDTVISPDVNETHSDHAAIAAFAMFAMDETGFTGRRLTAIVHYKLFPSPWAFLPESTLDPPAALAGDGSAWRSMELGPADVQAKRSALAKYPSELGIADYGVYLRAFVRRNELFDETAPARPASAPGDARPTAGANGTVVVMPRTGAAPTYAYAAPIDSLRMVRGPGVLWVGVTTRDPVSPRLDYRVSLRLIGGGDAPGRVDVLVRGGSAIAQQVSADSMVPGGVTASADDRTMWVSVPASVLAGRTHVLLGASAGPAGDPPFQTAWRDVAL
jgi:LmbE family N-acetylglucosaminyl deacetylase